MCQVHAKGQAVSVEERARHIAEHLHSGRQAGRVGDRPLPINGIQECIAAGTRNWDCSVAV